MQVNWSHAVVRVRDVDEMAQFYCDVLGFVEADRGTLGPDGTGPTIVFLSGVASDHHQIAFVQIRGAEEATSLDHTAFRVEKIADVKEMVKRVEANPQVPSGIPLTHGNSISVYFKDPEGNGVEVFCDSPWHVRQPQNRGWNPELSDAEILADIESHYKDEPDFAPMAEYQAKKAREFGEGNR